MTSQRGPLAEPGSIASTAILDSTLKQLPLKDIEKGVVQSGNGEEQGSDPALSENAPAIPKGSALKALGWLDRLLALWIFLAMAIGIILGNFVPNIAPALQQGKFVDVSIPIGICILAPLPSSFWEEGRR